MTANPDALRRAADEMEAQSARVERLVADLRDRADKIHEVRLELARAGFPVNEGAWPTEQLRALVDAYLNDGSSCGAIVRAAHNILNGSGIAHGGLVDRVTELHRRRDLLEVECSNLRGAHGELTAQRADLSRRLDASERDRVGLLATLETVRGERDKAQHSLDRYIDDSDVCWKLLTEAGIANGPIASRLTALIAERADLARRLEQAEDERDALRAPKVAAVEWHGCRLHVNGAYFGLYYEAREGGWWVLVNGAGPGPLPNEATARAVLLALADQPCGMVHFGLRRGATWEALHAARETGLGWVVDVLFRADGVSSRTADAEIVRAWVAHGQSALTIEAVTP